MDTEYEIRNIIQEICCRELSLDEELISSGILDSFRLLDLVCTLEDQFGIQFETDEIADMDHFSRLENIITLVKKKVNQKSNLRKMRFHWEAQ